jgi:hypothetical protein
MKKYPSITKEVIYDEKYYFFDKIDGSNIRAEWEKNKGFTKFGSREKQITKETPYLGESIDLIKEYEQIFTEIFDGRGYKSAVVFFEFFGENSKFGRHTKEKHHVLLIDVSVYKKGFLNPSKFMSLFEDKVPTANLLLYSEFTPEIESIIKSGKLLGTTYEGVVCKADRAKVSHPPKMFKVKTDQWISDLKDFCNGDLELFEKLK